MKKLFITCAMIYMVIAILYLGYIVISDPSYIINYATKVHPQIWIEVLIGGTLGFIVSKKLKLF